jgi:hypothetical protein
MVALSAVNSARAGRASLRRELLRPSRAACPRQALRLPHRRASTHGLVFGYLDTLEATAQRGEKRD